MEPGNKNRKPFWERIGAKYPYFGGYFLLQGNRFRGLEDIPPGKLKEQCHEYGFRSSDSQSMKAEAGFSARKGSFDTGPFGIYGAERLGLFLLKAFSIAPLSGSVVEPAAFTFSSNWAFRKVCTDLAQRAVKDGTGLPGGSIMSGFQGRMTGRTPANTFCDRVDVKIVYMHFLVIASGPVDRADQFHSSFFAILDIGVAAICCIAQHFTRNQVGFLLFAE